MIDATKDKNLDPEDNDLKVVPETDDQDVNLDPVDKIKKLKAELKACLAAKTEYLDGWQRSKADYLNLKREQEKQLAELAKFATQGLLLELIEVADTFDLAFADRAAWEKVDATWRRGMEHLHSKLKTVMTSHGLAATEPIGEVFDPEKHQAVGTVPVDSADEDHKIKEVLQAGYRLRERLIRPAKVKIGEFKNQ